MPTPFPKGPLDHSRRPRGRLQTGDPSPMRQRMLYDRTRGIAIALFPSLRQHRISSGRWRKLSTEHTGEDAPRSVIDRSLNPPRNASGASTHPSHTHPWTHRARLLAATANCMDADWSRNARAIAIAPFPSPQPFGRGFHRSGMQFPGKSFNDCWRRGNTNRVAAKGEIVRKGEKGAKGQGARPLGCKEIGQRRAIKSRAWHPDSASSQGRFPGRQSSPVGPGKRDGTRPAGGRFRRGEPTSWARLRRPRFRMRPRCSGA